VWLLALRIRHPLAFMKLGVMGAENKEDCVASTDAPNKSNRKQALSDSDQISLPTLRCNGEVWSEGSVQHPDKCTPCAFYCFKRWGCSKDKDCNFCHMNHVSKQRQRREEWKLCQREKRRSMRVQMQSTGSLPVGVTATKQIGSPQAKTLPDELNESCQEVYLVSEPSGAPLYAEEPCFIAWGSKCHLYQFFQTKHL